MQPNQQPSQFQNDPHITITSHEEPIYSEKKYDELIKKHIKFSNDDNVNYFDDTSFNKSGDDSFYESNKNKRVYQRETIDQIKKISDDILSILRHTIGNILNELDIYIMAYNKAYSDDSDDTSQDTSQNDMPDDILAESLHDDILAELSSQYREFADRALPVLLSKCDNIPKNTELLIYQKVVNTVDTNMVRLLFNNLLANRPIRTKILTYNYDKQKFDLPILNALPPNVLTSLLVLEKSRIIGGKTAGWKKKLLGGFKYKYQWISDTVDRLIPKNDKLTREEYLKEDILRKNCKKICFAIINEYHKDYYYELYGRDPSISETDNVPKHPELYKLDSPEFLQLKEKLLDYETQLKAINSKIYAQILSVEQNNNLILAKTLGEEPDNLTQARAALVQKIAETEESIKKHEAMVIFKNDLLNKKVYEEQNAYYDANFQNIE